MSNFDYTKARATAERLITKFGKASTFYAVGSTTEDMLGNVITTPGAVINGAITPKLNYSRNEIDGINIIASDGYAFFHSEIEPDIGMLTDLNGETLRVVSIKKLDSVDSINVYRKIQLRG